MGSMFMPGLFRGFVLGLGVASFLVIVQNKHRLLLLTESPTQTTLRETTSHESTNKTHKLRLDDAEIFNLTGNHYGPWRRWDFSIELPCFPLEPEWSKGITQRSKATNGILFVKPPKTGSSTAASVTLRIASRVGRDRDIPLCKNRVQHSKANAMNYVHRDKRKSILWSLVRDPTSRAVSQFFHFHVSRRNKLPSDDVFIDFIKERKELLTSFQLKYLAFQEDFDDSARVLNEIFTNYNLIGVTERFDETVVVLQMLLGLNATDVMYLSTKASGGYDDGRTENKCTFIQKSFISPRMQEYFDSEEWQEVIYWDSVLHRVANYTLDKTIDHLGRGDFQRKLAAFQSLKEEVDRSCASTVRLPCSSTGVKRNTDKTDCIYDDMGCGFECMDRVIGQGASITR
jgi:hypothetical protein